MSDIYEVLIVGAGPAGSSAAYHLAKQGLRVLLLDKLDFPRDKTCGDGLMPRCLPLLDEMNLLDDVLRIGHRCDTVRLVAPRGYTATVSLPQQDDRIACGLTIPRIVLDDMLRQRALACGAEFQSPVRVTDILHTGKCVEVRGECHRQSISFRAYMVIIAVGANTALLLRIGILKKMPRMALSARAYFEGATDMVDDIAQCYFNISTLGYGWIFPLSNSSINIGAGFLPPKRVSHPGPSTARGAFDAFIQTPQLRRILARAHCTSPVKGFPIRTDFATAPTFGERVMLVGEAAGLVHPITGDGIAYALESGKLAAEHLYTMFSTGDLSRKSLQRYNWQLRMRYQLFFSLYSCARSMPFLYHPATFSLLMNCGILSLDLAFCLPKVESLFLHAMGGTCPKLPKEAAR